MDYKRIKLGEIADITRGISYKGSDYSTVDDASAEAFINLKCITADGFRRNGIKYYNGKHKPSQSTGEGDLLIANTDLTRNREVIGNSILVPKLDRNQACFSHHLTKIEIHDETGLNKKYLYYYLKAPKVRSYMIGNSDGTTVVMLPAKAISKLEIEIPDLKIQKKIVHILSILDQKIELNNQKNAIYFDICRNLLNNYLSVGDLEEYDLSEFLNVFTGKRNANETNPDGKYIFFSCAPEPLKANTYIYDGPAIIIAGNGAYTGRTRFYEGKMELYQRTYACTPKNEDVKPLIYGFYVYMKNKFEREKMGGTHGSAIPYIVISDITKYKIPYNKEQFEKFSAQVKPFIKAIRENENENLCLTNLRNTLLPKLMSGAIDLSRITTK